MSAFITTGQMMRSTKLFSELKIDKMETWNIRNGSIKHIIFYHSREDS